jgi:hypothetical protein
MTERELDKFTDLSHLLATSTNVIITDISKIRFFVLSLDRVSLCGYGVSRVKFDTPRTMPLTSMDDGILSNYTELCGVGLDNLEFDSAHTATDKESVALADWPICCDAVMVS